MTKVTYTGFCKEATGYGMKPHTWRGRVVSGPFGKQTIKMYGRQMTVFVIGGEAE